MLASRESAKRKASAETISGIFTTHLSAGNLSFSGCRGQAVVTAAFSSSSEIFLGMLPHTSARPTASCYDPSFQSWGASAGAAALLEQLDVPQAGDDEASAAQQAELEQLVDKIERIDAQIAIRDAARHDPTAADISARAACELCVEISKLQVAQLTPQIYDGFEKDPNKALLLMMHNELAFPVAFLPYTRSPYT